MRRSILNSYVASSFKPEEQFQTNGLIESIYSSYFFRKDIIDEFHQKLMVGVPEGHVLSRYNFYNRDDLLNLATFTNPGSRYLQFKKTPKNVSKKNQGKNYHENYHGEYTSESENNLNKIIDHLSKNVCSDIGEKYSRNAVSCSLAVHYKKYRSHINYYDILFLAEDMDSSLPLKEKLDKIAGFIIVELGECKLYSKAYSIKLICSNKKIAISGLGSILMGAYLFTILSHPESMQENSKIEFPYGKGYHQSVNNGILFGTDEPLLPIQHKAILELADAYINSGGLCMYEKFGFKYNPEMYKLKPLYNNVNPNTNVKGIYLPKSETSTITISKQTKKQKVNKNALELSLQSKDYCFYDRHNLPMMIDFNTHPLYSSAPDKRQIIVNITLGAKYPAIEKSKICNIREPIKQKLLGYLKFFILQLSEGYTYEQMLYDYETYYTEQSIKYIDMSYLIRHLNGVDLNKLIDALENPTNSKPELQQFIVEVLEPALVEAGQHYELILNPPKVVPIKSSVTQKSTGRKTRSSSMRPPSSIQPPNSTKNIGNKTNPSSTQSKKRKHNR